MRKFKLTLGLLVTVFVALVIYQNREYFFTKQALFFILVPGKFEWTAPPFENVGLFGGCFAIGFLFAGYLGLMSKFKSMKNIKQLNKTVLSQTDTIESLKEELENFKKESYIDSNTEINESTNDPLLTEGSSPISTNDNKENIELSVVNLNKS